MFLFNNNNKKNFIGEHFKNDYFLYKILSPSTLKRIIITSFQKFLGKLNYPISTTPHTPTPHTPHPSPHIPYTSHFTRLTSHTIPHTPTSQTTPPPSHRYTSQLYATHTTAPHLTPQTPTSHIPTSHTSTPHIPTPHAHPTLSFIPLHFTHLTSHTTPQPSHRYT